MSEPREGKSRANVLSVGTTAPSAELVSSLKARGYGALHAASAAAASETLEQLRPSIVVAQLPLADASAGALARELQRINPSVVIIFVGADAEVRNAADAFDLGAYDYLERATTETLLAVLGSAIGGRAGDTPRPDLRQQSEAMIGWGTLISDSPAMQNVVSMLRQICRRTWSGGAPTMLLSGETGTGKGFFAKCIHHNSARRNEAFVEINCAALPPSLIEAELFGYERGAFTDAKTARMGLFEAANGGTLFLDEIAALPLDLQAKLLKAIEEKKVRRLGARQSLVVDVQIIAATHENVESLAKTGLFRVDLFHRLNVVAVTIPSLRDRGNDVLLLAEAFVTSICQEYGMPPRHLTDGARDWIRRYGWPGNVRELRNRIERIILLENDDELRAEHFGPVSVPASGSVRVSMPPTGLRVALPAEGVPLEALERAVIREALVRCDGNVSRAARFLSISRQTLIYRMKKHGLIINGESSPRLLSVAPRPTPRLSRRAVGR